MSRMTEQEIIELLQAYKPGDVVEYQPQERDSDVWYDTNTPAWNFFDTRYRLKELTPDQRKLKEAEAKVKELEQEIVQLKERVAELEKQDEGWIPWTATENSASPVPSYTLVEIEQSDGLKGKGRADSWR